MFDSQDNSDIEAKSEGRLIKTLSKQTMGRIIEVHRVDALYDHSLLLPSKLDGSKIRE